MSDTNLANSPEARTETGEIKDQTQNPNPNPEPQKEPAPAPTDPKPADKKPADPKTALLNEDIKPEKKEEAKAEGAPEKYEPFKVPEGHQLDEELSTKAEELFRKHNLSQTAAQELVDFYSEKAFAAAQEPYNHYKEVREGWRKEVVADNTLGDGKDIKPEVKSTIASAIDSLEPKIAQSFREAMDLTGVGDHPAFVRAIYEIAKRGGEGSLVRGGTPAPVTKPGTGPQSAAQRIYPDLPSSSAS